MKKTLAILFTLTILCCACLPACALGNDWLVRDSNTRLMTSSECWGWSYDGLGFVMHEILARRGFVFDPNGAYAWYFTNQGWYHAIASRDNQEVYNSLNKTEWANISLIKQVRASMRSSGTKNPGGKPAPARSGYYQTGYAEPLLVSSVFQEIQVNGNLKMAVYSAPSASSWRGANGKAMCTSLNGQRSGVYAAGREGSWVLIAYYLNHGANQGGWRVGYVRSSELKGLRTSLRQLSFYYLPCQLSASCQLTDDPLGYETPITTLGAGTDVTLLMRFVNPAGKQFAYIETMVYGQTIRGFVPLSCLDDMGAFGS